QQPISLPFKQDSYRLDSGSNPPVDRPREQDNLRVPPALAFPKPPQFYPPLDENGSTSEDWHFSTSQTDKTLPSSLIVTSTNCVAVTGIQTGREDKWRTITSTETRTERDTITETETGFKTTSVRFTATKTETWTD